MRQAKRVGNRQLMNENESTGEGRRWRSLAKRAGRTTMMSIIAVLSLLFSNGVAAQHEMLHGFDTSGGSQAPLLHASDGNFYGTLVNDGGWGSIFRMDGSGALSRIHEFSDSDGRNPYAGLVELGGELYGTTFYGGANGYGTIFRITTGGTLTTLHHFSHSDGAYPRGELIVHGGELYGTTQQGGSSGGGTAFKITSSGTLTSLVSFSGSNGSSPQGPLVELGGEMYGTTLGGGTYGYGTVFKLTLGSTPALTVLYSFNYYSTVGMHPHAGLVTMGGNLYGATSNAYSSGGYGYGSVFEITTTGSLRVLHQFNNPSVTGYYAQGELRVLGGELYGTTVNGGANGNGTIFKVTAAATPVFTSLFSFSSSSSGAYPYAGLIDVAGELYGTTWTGGTGNDGTIFKLTLGASPSLTTLHDLSDDGESPAGGLLYHDGALYGTTISGGDHSQGTVYRMTPDGDHTQLHSFAPGEGANPMGELVELGGELYGTTQNGGANGYGTIFKVTSPGGTATVSTLHDFDSTAGANPRAGLVVVGGDLYGTTYTGGASSLGTVYRYSPGATPAFTVIYEMTSGGGSNPWGSLLELGGKLYGTTHTGGAGYGTVFELTLDGTWTNLHSFTYAHGANPIGGLVEFNGHLYGTTSSGGPFNRGAIYRISPGGSFELLHSFNGSSDGSHPRATLLQVGGSLYGTAQYYGALNRGTLFRIEPGKGLDLLYSFNYTEGAYPEAKLIELNGYLYGTTFSGGPGGGTIFRHDVNFSPDLAPVADQTVAEGSTLSFTLSASDRDSDPITFSMSGHSWGASLDSSTGVFTWTPEYFMAGTHQVTFTASDGQGGSHSRTATLTVTDTNRDPAIVHINDQTVAEGSTISFRLTAVDPDGDSIVYGSTGLPAGATLDPSSGSFSWTPGTAGVFNITFTASDGKGGTASDAVTITVVAPNGSPVLGSIGNRSVATGATLAFGLTASDPDGDTVTFSASGMPAGATLDGTTGAFSWTPAPGDAGNHYVTFTVSDGNGGTDSELITITVTSSNAAPVLDPIGNRIVASGSTVSISLTANDADLDALTFSASGLPAGATLDATSGAFDWTTSASDVGFHHVTFSVSDGNGGTDSELVTISVTDSNQSPLLVSIGPKSVTAGSMLAFTVSASDPDGDALTYSAVNLPAAASFSSTTGSFSWTPVTSDTGTHYVTFTASDGRGGSDSERIAITVTSSNAAPVLSPIGNRSVPASSSLAFTVQASDADADPLTYLAEGLPGGAMLDGATGDFLWTPTVSDIGSYNIEFTVIDGNGGSDDETITITVTDPNRAPLLATIGNRAVVAGSTLSFIISATDADGDSMIYSATGLPAGATLDGATGAFGWTPGSGDVGVHYVTFTVSDGNGGADSELISITVTASNVAPVLASIGNKSVATGSTLSFVISASDADGDSVSYGASGVPAGVSFDGVSGAFDWSPGTSDVGSYNVTFTASDGRGGMDSELITITVTDSNRAPLLGSIGNRTVAAGSALGFTISATDPDGDAIVYSAAGLPSGATLDSATGGFGWAPSSAQVGSHSVTFTASDGRGGSDSEMVTISVTEPNAAPVLASIGNRNALTGVMLSFTVTASDPDGDGLTYGASGLPAGASLNSVSGSFSWTPAASDIGTHNVTFTASDGRGGSDAELITITVASSNTPPVLASVGSREISAGSTLSFRLMATDADADVVTFAATGLPAGAGLDSVSGVFTWTPAAGDVGDHAVSFTASDGRGGSDSELISITVIPANGAPVLDSIGNRTVAEDEALAFTLSATDPNGDVVTFNVTGLPYGATLDFDSGEFAWTPDFEQSGTYYITFTASDGKGGSDSESISIRVTDTNRAPVLSAIGNRDVAEGATLSFTVSATDPDGDGVVIVALSLPAGASFDATTGVFDWTPGFSTAGSHTASFSVSDGRGGTDDETITITVTESGIPGDANGDGRCDVADVFYLVNYLFAAGPDPVHGDANGSGSVDVADVFYLINYLFADGPAPVEGTSSVALSSSSVLEMGVVGAAGSQRMVIDHGERITNGPRTWTVPIMMEGDSRFVTGMSIHVEIAPSVVAYARIVRGGSLTPLPVLFEASPATDSSSSYIVAFAPEAGVLLREGEQIGWLEVTTLEGTLQRPDDLEHVVRIDASRSILVEEGNAPTRRRTVSVQN